VGSRALIPSLKVLLWFIIGTRPGRHLRVDVAFTKVGRSTRSSERLTFHPDDARAYIQKTDQKFDLIVYSILDSNTTSSYYTNIRLENYA